MNTDDVTCLPEGSICGTCIYCVMRFIEPLDEEAYEIYSHEDKDSNIFAHSACLILDVDLHDHVVKGCNKYDDGASENPLGYNKFL